jgi:hypothetical protein
MYDNKRPVYFVFQPDRVGEMVFTFNGEKLYNLFKDYPYALTPGEKEIFDKEFPYWAEFFKDRKSR